MNKLRKGDQVIVLTGRDKGKKGQIEQMLEDKVLVTGINQVKKNQKPNPMKNETGGIITKTMPIHISNVAIFNSATSKADRVGIKVEVDGKKQRIFKSTGEVIA